MAWKHVFAALAVLFFGYFAYLIYFDAPGQLLVLIAAILCILGSRAGDIAKLNLSATGIQAEMEKTLSDAKATLGQLHLLAKLLASTMLEVVHGEGRWGGGVDKEKVKSQLSNVLTDIGIPAEEIKKIELDAEYKFNHFDYVAFVSDLVTTEQKMGERHAEWSKFWAHDVRKGIGYEPSPKELRGFLAKLDLITPEIDERLNDYAHYEQHKAHRRPDEWAKRGKR